jgi:hypothetical protein
MPRASTGDSGVRYPTVGRADFLTDFLSPALTGKKIGGGEVPVITKCFFITKSFQENSGAENLLLRVHEHYSDLSSVGNYENIHLAAEMPWVSIDCGATAMRRGTANIETFYLRR